VASSEVRTPNPQVARVDNRLPISGAPPPARLPGASIEKDWKKGMKRKEYFLLREHTNKS